MIAHFPQHARRLARRLAPASILLSALILTARPSWAQG
jgi:hypothetical protein